MHLEDVAQQAVQNLVCIYEYVVYLL